MALPTTLGTNTLVGPNGLTNYSTLGKVGNLSYYQVAKPGGYDYYKDQTAGNLGGFKLSYADLQKELAAANGGAPASNNPYLSNQAGAVGGAIAAPAPINLDFAGIQARARAQAEGSVNPLYAQKLNDFLANQATQASRAQADKATNDKLIQEGLQNLTDQNALTGTRTAQDVAANLNNIGNQENYYQQQEGQGFDQARTAQQQQIAQSGLTGSGLGNQQLNQAVTQRNQQSGQQVQGFNIQKQAQQTLQTRTFQDLAKSTELGTKSAGTQSSQNQLNLNRFIEDQANSLQTEKQNEYVQQQADIQAAQNRYAKEQFVNALQGIGNTGTRLATQQAYSGLF